MSANLCQPPQVKPHTYSTLPIGLTLDEAARLASVSKSTICRWREREEHPLKSIRIAGRVIIRRETLEQFLKDEEERQGSL